MADLNELKPINYVQNLINKFCYTIGMIPTSYKMSLTYEEQILAIGRYLETVVYPAINNNAEAVAELQRLYIDLKNYIDNYFEDLNIQNEINNKLDEMTQDGTLANIINNELLENINNEINNLSNKLTAIDYKFSYFNDVLSNNLAKNITTKVICTGDSLTYGQDPTNGSRSYTNYPQTLQNFINDWYGENSVEFINKGIQGAKSDIAINNFNEYLQQNPDVITWSFGTNDITQGISINSIIENLETFYNLCINNNIQLIVFIPPPSYVNKLRNTQMGNLQKALLSFCKKNGIEYIDMFEYVINLYNNNRYNQLTLQPDNSHFTDYRIYRDAFLIKILNNLFVQSPSKNSYFTLNNVTSKVKTNGSFVMADANPLGGALILNALNHLFETNFYIDRPSTLTLIGFKRSIGAKVKIKLDKTVDYEINSYSENTNANDSTWVFKFQFPTVLNVGMHNIQLSDFISDSGNFYIFGFEIKEIEFDLVNLSNQNSKIRIEAWTGLQLNGDIPLSTPLTLVNSIMLIIGGGNNYWRSLYINDFQPYHPFTR